MELIIKKKKKNVIHGVDTSPFMESKGRVAKTEGQRKKENRKKRIRKEVYYLRHGVQTQELC